MEDVKSFIKTELESYFYLKNPSPQALFLPFNVYIEPTNACNLDCIFCARNNMTRKIGSMPLENFKKIINKFVAENFRPTITITGNGEPLLHKDIFKMIKYAKEKNFNVSLIANSTLLNDEKIKELLGSGLDRYQTNFESIEKEEYEALKKRAVYDHTKKQILNLIEENKKNDCKLFISITIIETDINKNSIKKTEEFWRSKKVDNIYLSPLFSLQTNSGLYNEAMANINTNDFQTCVIPWVSMSISYDGEVLICAQDFNNKYTVGNIFSNNDVKEIWNSDKAQQLRKAIIEKNCHFLDSKGYNCSKCNTPHLGYSIKDYLDNSPERILKKIKTFH